MQKMTFYFAIEGIIGSGKMTLLEWLKIMLLEDGHTFYMIPKPVEKFKKKITYKPLKSATESPYKVLLWHKYIWINLSNITPKKLRRPER